MLPDAFELVVLLEDAKRPVVAYASVWNGKRYFHIRALYEDKDGWKPGKGVSIPYEQKDVLLTALNEVPLTGA